VTQLTDRRMTTSHLLGGLPGAWKDEAISRHTTMRSAPCYERRRNWSTLLSLRVSYRPAGLRPTLEDETMEPGRGSSRRPRVMPANASRIPRRRRNFGCLLLSPVATLAPPRRVPLDTRFRGYDRGLTRTSCSCFLSAQRSNPGPHHAAQDCFVASLLAMTIQIDRTSRRGVGPTPAHTSASDRSMASPNDSRRSSRPAGARNCTPVGIPAASAPEGSESPHMRKRLPSRV
jgi:hypothetical protein